MRACVPIGLAVLVLLIPGTSFTYERGPYDEARRLLWTEVYGEGGETLYCGVEFGSRHPRSLNVEHVFPMKWVMNELRCGDRDRCRRTSDRFNRIEADLHNLWPSRLDVNKARRSYPFAELGGEPRPFSGCDFEVDKDKRLVEPRPASRGEIARSMFYMSERYELRLHQRQAALLKRWHFDDPVSDEERRRNDVIEKLQGNRNPFIDEPDRMSR